MEGGIAVVEGMYLLDRLILERDLEFEESGLDADEAGLAPTDGGELVDQSLLDVGRGVEGAPTAVEVELPGGEVFDAEDVAGGGGKAVFE